MKKIPALLLCMLALAACARKTRDYSNIPDKGQVADGGTFIDSDTSEASKLNVILADDVPSGAVCDLLCNGLVRYNDKLELEGDLAESWQVSEGGKVIRFKLRHGVKWHDGAPFSSADVKFTWMKIMDPKTATPRKSDFALVDSIDTPDDFTVVVRYKQPYAPALESWGQGLIPKHLLESEKDINTAAFNRHPIGTGPYKFVQWKDKQFIELAANPEYYEGKPHITRYIFKFIPDQSTQFLELKAGSVDTIALTPDQFLKQSDGDDFKRVARKDRITGFKRYAYMGFNLKRDIFKDLRVRRALSYAIDRQAIIDGVLLGYGKPCSGPYVPVMPAYNPEVAPVPLDLSKSAALLDEAGWKAGKDGIRMKDGKPLVFRLLVSQGSETGKKIVLILQQQFEKIGVKAELESYEWSIFLNDHVNTRNFDAVVMSWNLSLDPDQYAIWHSSQTKPTEFNFVSYNNPEVDRILELGRITFDPAKRIAMYRRMHKLIADDQPYCFLFAQDMLPALSLKVQGVKMTPTGYSWGWYRDWYIPTSLQQ